jgi:hypothetical protein
MKNIPAVFARPLSSAAAGAMTFSLIELDVGLAVGDHERAADRVVVEHEADVDVEVRRVGAAGLIPAAAGGDLDRALVARDALVLEVDRAVEVAGGGLLVGPEALLDQARHVLAVLRLVARRRLARAPAALGVAAAAGGEHQHGGEHRQQDGELGARHSGSLG